MPVHDWSRVEAGIFHDIHSVWIAELRNALNEGLLPSGYYALAEQHAGHYIPDLLTLHAPPPRDGALIPPSGGGTAVLEAPPKVRRKVIVSAARQLRRTLAIRHVSGHRLIAMIEIVSPANKDRPAHVEEFARKIEEALRRGVHVLLVDIFAPGIHDPHGMHGAVWQLLDDEPTDLPPPGEPLTLSSYVADTRPEAYLEHLTFGSPLPEMPLFLNPERYINVPLEATYQSAYRGTPAYWRGVVEGGGGNIPRGQE